MASAFDSGNLRNWFEDTSAAFARLCNGKLYLIVDAEPADIWSGSIWLTHEYPAIVQTGTVTQITEIRPEDVGTAVANNGNTRYIRHYPYRGGQPPGATPPRDDDTSEIASCVSIDPNASNAKWASVVDVSGDISPFKEGTCTFHVHEYYNPNAGGGGGIGGDPNFPSDYSVEITLYDDGATHRIGYQARLDAPYSMASKLDNLFVVTPSDSNIKFTVGSVTFTSDDGSCSVGGWNHGADRQMDCGFPCTWGGGDSTDHTEISVFLPLDG
ncbi:hypothetical protein B0H13DRAFT_1049505 [Mycena leptocephala]|nr:hypothetical protein B0H13DRAFT_1049505 [Mycena leptocephala]